MLGQTLQLKAQSQRLFCTSDANEAGSPSLATLCLTWLQIKGSYKRSQRNAVLVFTHLYSSGRDTGQVHRARHLGRCRTSMFSVGAPPSLWPAAWRPLKPHFYEALLPGCDWLNHWPLGIGLTSSRFPSLGGGESLDPLLTRPPGHPSHQSSHQHTLGYITSEIPRDLAAECQEPGDDQIYIYYKSQYHRRHF